MAATCVLVGGFWIGIVGYLRYARGVNETISSLLMTYIGIAIMNFFVEGALRDFSNPNKPSTKPIGDAYMVGYIPGTEVHWGLARRAWCSAIALYILLSRTTFGFAVRVSGGNPRAALAQGLPVGKLIVICCAIAGACAGLAGFFEVAAIQGRANASLAAGYGYTGILVAFLARHNPLAIIPVAILFGGIVASGGLIERRMGLPDATVLVLAGPDLRHPADVGDACTAASRFSRSARAAIAHERQSASLIVLVRARSAARCACRRRSCSSRSASASRKNPAGSISASRARSCSAP